MATPKMNDIAQVSEIHDKIENLIHTTDLHEDIIESFLAPIEKYLVENGVNIQEQDI